MSSKENGMGKGEEGKKRLMSAVGQQAGSLLSHGNERPRLGCWGCR